MQNVLLEQAAQLTILVNVGLSPYLFMTEADVYGNGRDGTVCLLGVWAKWQYLYRYSFNSASIVTPNDLHLLCSTHKMYPAGISFISICC